MTALGGAHSNHCRAIYMNGCFAGPEFTNPLHVAQLLNAKLPLANWFPVFISFQEMAGLRATQAFIDKETGAPPRTLAICFAKKEVYCQSIAWLQPNDAACVILAGCLAVHGMVVHSTTTAYHSLMR